MMNEKVSPEYVKISTAAAMTLKFFPGRFNRGERLNALNLLVSYDDGCKARCGYCGLSQSRDLNEKTFIRVDWPLVSVDDIIERTKKYGKHLDRVCVSMVTHPKAFNDMCSIMKKFQNETDLLISGLISPTLIHKKEDLMKIKDSGADWVGIAMDAATPYLFDKYRGKGVNGPHKWDHYWHIIEWSVECFGRDKVGVHLIVGLDETEKDMVETIQKCEDIGAKGQLFSFFPEAGSNMENRKQPSYGQYRRIQLARYLINEGLSRFDQMEFNDKDQIISFGTDIEPIVQSGEAFMTSGCPGHDGSVACNRPYGNERPSQPIRNYAFHPNSSDIEIIRGQLFDYQETKDTIEIIS
jgi:biotin synthase